MHISRAVLRCCSYKMPVALHAILSPGQRHASEHSSLSSAMQKYSRQPKPRHKLSLLWSRLKNAMRVKKKKKGMLAAFAQKVKLSSKAQFLLTRNSTDYLFCSTNSLSIISVLCISWMSSSMYSAAGIFLGRLQLRVCWGAFSLSHSAFHLLASSLNNDKNRTEGNESW